MHESICQTTRQNCASDALLPLVQRVFFLFLTFTMAWLPGTSLGSPLVEKSIQTTSGERGYLLFTPHKKPGKKPLVIVLHGGGGNGQNAADMTDFQRVAMKHQFYLAFPNGSGRKRERLLTWNARHCCGYAMKQNVDDVGFIRTLIDRLIATEQIDEKRIYVTGMSNGAMLTHRLGIELGDRVAAIATVVGTLFGDEVPTTMSLPVMIINGALDKAVKPEGGQPGGRAAFAWDGTPTKPSQYQATFWAKVNQCEASPAYTEIMLKNAKTLSLQYSCPRGSEVIYHLIGDNGHAWPGGKKGSKRGDEPGKSFNASEEIWSFFARHAR